MGNETQEAFERGLSNPKEKTNEVLQETKESEMPQETMVEDKGKIEESFNPLSSTGKIEVPIIENPIKSNEKKRVRGLSIKKSLMIKSLIKSMGIVTTAANVTGINPSTHYEWLKDPKYRAEYEKAILSMKDKIENALLSLVLDKNPQAVIFAAKTKLRDRGYGEKIDINSEVNVHGGLSLENDPREIMRRIEERRKRRAEEGHS